MIKIFVGKPEEIEEQVNAFMQEKNLDLPVRTNIINDTFIATVFYNKVTEPIVSNQGIQGENDNIGALWFKNGLYEGNISGKRVILAEADWEALDSYDSKIGKIKKLPLKDGGLAKILPNQYKKTPNHPDFIVLKETAICKEEPKEEPKAENPNPWGSL